MITITTPGTRSFDFKETIILKIKDTGLFDSNDISNVISNNLFVTIHSRIVSVTAGLVMLVKHQRRHQVVRVFDLNIITVQSSALSQK